jgi:hypothetical protein
VASSVGTLTPWISSYATATSFSLSTYTRNTDTGATGHTNILNLTDAGGTNRFIVGGDATLGLTGNIFVEMYQGGAITYQWRSTKTYQDSLQHALAIRTDATGISVYIDGVVDKGLFQTTLGGSGADDPAPRITYIRLGGVTGTDATNLYWEYVVSGANRTCNVYRGYDAGKVLVASGLANNTTTPVALAAQGGSGISGFWLMQGKTTASNVNVNHTITFPYGVNDTAVSPSIVNTGSNLLTAGTYGDTYSGLDETKFWNRSLLDHELRSQYLFDRIIGNLPYVEGVGFSTTQDDQWYMYCPAAAKRASSPTNLRGLGTFTWDGSVATLPAVGLYLIGTNHAAIATTQLQYNFLTSTYASGAGYAFRANHSNTNATCTQDIYTIYAQCSAAGSGKPFALYCASGNIGFTSSASEGVIWGTKHKIYSDNTNLIIDPKISGSGVVSLNGGSLSTTGDIMAATYHVGATAGIDATVSYVDTVLGAKVLTFSKGILTAQT